VCSSDLVIMGLGGENDEDTTRRIEARGPISDEEIIKALCAVLRQDAFNHRDLQALDGRHANGMAVMFMGASTGCNTVYGSTPPSNPHPYPWMNSLFQDGATISWLLGESLIMQHARRSVAPERLGDALLQREEAVCTESDYFQLTHLDDTSMTDQEIRELPKVWVVGGDGALGDIGFQNVSKVILQNRPNVKMLMLDTQVYSNTGGQSSKATPTGAVAKFAAAGKRTKKKDLGLIAMSYGYVYVASVAMGSSQTQLLKALNEAEAYDGPSIVIAYCPCINQGVNMAKSQTEEKAAVESGYWTLYRYNPMLALEGKNPFQLDSKPPTMDYKEFLDREIRYTSLKRQFPEIAEVLFEKAAKEAQARYEYYEKLAKL